MSVRPPCKPLAFQQPYVSNTLLQKPQKYAPCHPLNPIGPIGTQRFTTIHYGSRAGLSQPAQNPEPCFCFPGAHCIRFGAVRIDRARHGSVGHNFVLYKLSPTLSCCGSFSCSFKTLRLYSKPAAKQRETSTLNAHPLVTRKTLHLAPARPEQR